MWVLSDNRSSLSTSSFRLPDMLLSSVEAPASPEVCTKARREKENTHPTFISTRDDKVEKMSKVDRLALKISRHAGPHLHSIAEDPTNLKFLIPCLEALSHGRLSRELWVINCSRSLPSLDSCTHSLRLKAVLTTITHVTLATRCLYRQLQAAHLYSLTQVSTWLNGIITLIYTIALQHFSTTEMNWHATHSKASSCIRSNHRTSLACIQRHSLAQPSQQHPQQPQQVLGVSRATIALSAQQLEFSKSATWTWCTIDGNGNALTLVSLDNSLVLDHLEQWWAWGCQARGWRGP
ncbi:hypothetical protein BKA67DRAFT_215394 [Truncatella angustata]|uniref:Uncharacterized protein n=1 Tax=Truncatella angustata TaxID=152316 RepID=A0A9P8UV09_9PEZI|nr:uncharacterized protein BKA67DRAFT_215394 [Truncatella angustata]KAH6658515.1 hypothetical protein BKA67DRAFT_215394 [Truncatella angustata]